jgi:hypothetical protein
MVTLQCSFLTRMRFTLLLLVEDTLICYKHSAWRHFTPIEKACNALERTIHDVQCQILLYPFSVLIVVLLLRIYSTMNTNSYENICLTRK